MDTEADWARRRVRQSEQQRSRAVLDFVVRLRTFPGKASAVGIWRHSTGRVASRAHRARHLRRETAAHPNSLRELPEGLVVSNDHPLGRLVAILPLFISLGLLEATDRLRRAASRYLSPRLASGFAVAIFAAAVAFSFRGAWKQYAIRSDSRNLALEWLSRNAPADARIVVDQSLAMDLSASSSRWRVRTGKMSQAFNAHDAKAGRRFVVVGTNAPLPAPLRELQPQFRAGSGKGSRPARQPALGRLRAALAERMDRDMLGRVCPGRRSRVRRRTVQGA